MKLPLQAPFKGGRLKVACAPLLVALFLPGAGYAVESNFLKIAPEIKVSSRFVNVTGTVRDNKGEPLPGVSIKIKGTTTGTTSDVNGVFRLNLPTGNETLVISFLGFKTVEVAAAGQSSLVITLEDEVSNLEEVVVIGYGTVKRKDLTGAVASVKAEEIMRTPTANVMDAMQSKVAGMEIMI